jgi:methylenetetrahydrofolate dehydrogenase (NADP+)/methenyltetrahydrofolate cyclohydrolase
MQILDGKIVSQNIKNELKLKVEQLILEGKRPPHLNAILIGNNGASETYVASKVRNCEEIGFKSSLIRLDENISEKDLTDIINSLNDDRSVDGILVQLPLPPHIREEQVIQLIRPEKDVDGFSPYNTGRMTLGMSCYIPATPYGILLMLEHYNINTSGKHAVVIGRSNIVGRPISILLSQSPYNCTVTLCHSRTKDLNKICLDADILIAAIGSPGFVTGNMSKDGAIIIDVGITRVPDTTKKSGYKIQGDVDFDSAAQKCSAITPVPGGVGLMTIAALLKNTLNAYLNQQQ